MSAEPSPRPLRVLCLEDSPIDADLVGHTLTAAGYEVDMSVAAGREDFEELVSADAYDVILADFSLPDFDGHAALALAKTACPATPFICVSGTIGEEATVELLKDGADDCVLKDKMARLPFAIDRAISEKAQRSTLTETEARYREVLEHGGVGVAYYDLDGRILLLNLRAVQNLGGIDAGQFVGKDLTELFGEEAGRLYTDRLRETAASREVREHVDHVELPIGQRWLASIHTPALDATGEVVGVHVYAQDITARKLAEEAVAAAASQWRETFDAMADSVALFDEGGTVLRCNAATVKLVSRSFEDIVGRPCYEVFHGTEEFHPQCPQRRAFESGHTESSVFEQDGHWLRATFAPRVDDAGHVSGGVHVVTDVTELMQTERRLLESVAKHAAVTDGVIAALARTVEIRDPYTAGHERRVSGLATAMARHMRLDARGVRGVEVAGKLHDVGKIIVPAEILTKPGRLSAMEFELIKGHAEAGSEILGAIDFPWPVADLTLQHHERLDGSGYPGGLSGEEILPGARILAVADVVEAMSSHRPYRAALGIEAALEEIRRNAGVKYDSDAAAACAHVFAEGFEFAE
jgi:PAS domain S-box-containing protein